LLGFWCRSAFVAHCRKILAPESKTGLGRVCFGSLVNMVGRLSDVLPGLGRLGNGAVPFAMRSVDGYSLIWLVVF
jgi:hypothetical protein